MSSTVPRPKQPSPEPDTPVPEQDPSTAVREATDPESPPVPEAEPKERA